MADLLSGGVTRGLVGAATSMKTAQVCMTVYSAAKARGDEATMERALGYASDNMSSARDSTEESRTALAENVKTAREEEKAEQADRLEKARIAADEKRAEMQDNVHEEGTNKILDPVDTVEISPEAIAALQNENSGTEAQSDDVSDESINQPKQRKEKPIVAKHTKLYTPVDHVKVESGENVKTKRVEINIKV